jgi:hypothetical protein
MLARVIFGLIGVVLMTVFVGAILVKLKDPALGTVLLIGLVLMLFDYWQSLREGD